MHQWVNAPLLTKSGWDDILQYPGRNKVRWRPGQATSLAPPCSNLSSFGSKCAVEESTCDIVGTFRHPRNHSATGQFRPPCPSSLRLC